MRSPEYSTTNSPREKRLVVKMPRPLLSIVRISIPSSHSFRMSRWMFLSFSVSTCLFVNRFRRLMPETAGFLSLASWGAFVLLDRSGWGSLQLGHFLILKQNKSKYLEFRFTNFEKITSWGNRGEADRDTRCRVFFHRGLELTHRFCNLLLEWNPWFVELIDLTTIRSSFFVYFRPSTGQSEIRFCYPAHIFSDFFAGFTWQKDGNTALCISFDGRQLSLRMTSNAILVTRAST